VRAWIDDYARRFRELTDPVWLKIIEDPQSRWYKEKDEYKNLFRFRKKTEPVTKAGRLDTDFHGSGRV
jgi:hypothetical protein